LLLDLLLVPALLWSRTRPFAFAGALAFHLLNARLFRIGIFPWFMLAATTLFFDPGWPRRLLGGRPMATASRAAAATEKSPWTPRRRLAAGLLGVFFAIQLLLPLRHHLYPGDVNWTEEGHRFSWHMKLRDKDVAEARFVVKGVAGDTLRVVEPRDVLPRWMIERAMSRPDMVHQLARHIAERERRRGHGDVRVHAHVRASLNGRAPQLLVNPDVDLAAEPRSWRTATWIVPLADTPLPDPARSRSRREGEELE
ncbi:MAG: HTTM domain-containing protein, partial [Candidatus Eisenbacteria bacterium]